MRKSPEFGSPRAAAAASAEAGISLLEVLIAVAVMVLGFLALAQTIVTTHSLRRNSDERRVMLTALRIVGEEVRAVADEARTTPNRWSETVISTVQAGERLGPRFGVQGLAPWSGASEVGALQVVTDETVTDADLGVEIGMPRDLDGDGQVSNLDVSSTASLLPVVMTLRFDGVTGRREVRRGFYVSRF